MHDSEYDNDMLWHYMHMKWDGQSTVLTRWMVVVGEIILYDGRTIFRWMAYTLCSQARMYGHKMHAIISR